jgi:thiamine transport system permease protein
VFSFRKSTQTQILFEHFRISRNLGIISGFLLAAIGCSILLRMFFMAGGNYYWVEDGIDVIFAKSTVLIIKSAAWQASLSTLISLLIGLSCARALYRRNNHWMSKIVLSTSFLALVVPSSVAALGIVGVWGRNGLLGTIGGEMTSPFGLWMVVLAHAFFNAPLVLRVAFSSLQAQPAYFWKIAAQRHLTTMQIFKLIEWSAFQPLILPLSSLIFLLCFTSFSIVLMLGGGPNVTTLEVSIYHAVRFAFDLPLAAMLSILQIIICSGLILLSKPFTLHITSPTANKGTIVCRSDHGNIIAKTTDYIWLAIFFILIFLPLIALFYRLDLTSGLSLFNQKRFWDAFFTSTNLSLLSALISVCIAVILIHSRFRLVQSGNLILTRFIDFSVSYYLLMPAIVFATGCFILLRDFISLFDVAFWLVLMANILFSLPFITRILAPSLERVLAQHDKLSLQLGITGIRRFSTLTLPALHRELQLVLGISFAFSLGDLSVITLFGSQNFETLPFYLYQLFSRYGASEADMLGMFLLVYIFMAYLFFGFVFWCFRKFHTLDRVSLLNAYTR